MSKRQPRRARRVEDVAAEAFLAASAAVACGGRAALAQPLEALPAAARPALAALLAEAGDTARTIARSTPLERRTWALERMAEVVANRLLPVDTRLAALKMFTDTEGDLWRKLLDAFPPTPPGVNVNFPGVPGASDAAMAAAALAAARSANSPETPA